MTGKDLPERVEATQGLRRSSAAGTHQDRRTRRQRAREAAKRKALEDQQDGA